MTTTAELPDVDWHDAGFMTELRRQMVRFAHLQLQDAALAEDAVQEALIGALTGAKRFAGRAALKTWVFAILKNKVIDVLRHKQRMVDASSLLKEGEDQSMDDLFDARGHWLADSRPQGWSNPDGCLHQQQFWMVFEACIDGVPPQQARVFMMREFMEFETGEICEQVGVSQANVFVLLHRARMRLRECLDLKWFSGRSA